MTATGDDSLESNRDATEHYGREVVRVSRYEPGVTDFFPILTRIVADNPDAIGICDGPIGDQALIVKQARELGYKGVFIGANSGDPVPLVEIAGKEAVEGFLMNDPDYSCDLYPESTRQLYAEFQQIHPGGQFALTQYLGYASIMFYKQAIEENNNH